VRGVTDCSKTSLLVGIRACHYAGDSLFCYFHHAVGAGASMGALTQAISLHGNAGEYESAKFWRETLKWCALLDTLCA
jgi:hypothetical protein